MWAIGRGEGATRDVAQDMMAHVRSVLASLYGADASDISLLYGGSVNPGNTTDYMREQDINGALVGGAALNADSFVEIAAKAAEARA